MVSVYDRIGGNFIDNQGAKYWKHMESGFDAWQPCGYPMQQVIKLIFFHERHY